MRLQLKRGAARLRRLPRRAVFGGAAALLALLLGTAWLLSAPRPAFERGSAALRDRGGDALRGRRVFAAADCGSCHASPGQSDRLRLGGGLALASQYGVLHVPNISQHARDGIGRWRTVDLANALLSGVSPDGRHYFPGFPYTSYAHMELRDVVDLMAYLRTLPPVAGRAPPHELAFPFNVRRLIGLWKRIYLDRSPVLPDTRRDVAWNRGHYLVESLSHCAECHSSRDVFGGIKPKTRYAGGRDPEGTGFVPNITPQAIGSWQVADITRLLEDGRTPDLRTVGSSMASIVENTRSLPAEDRAAIAVYLKTLPPRPTATP